MKENLQPWSSALQRGGVKIYKNIYILNIYVCVNESDVKKI